MSRAEAFCASRGFSLVELVIAMVIFILIAAVSIPWFNRIRRRAEFRSAAMEISTTLVAARMKAVKLNGNASVAITPAADMNSPHEIDTIEPPPPPTPPAAPAANPLVRLFLSGRSLRFVTTPDSGITFDGSGRRIAPLSPTPGAIVIEGPLGGGPVNTITIDTNTSGRVRIITPAVWQ